MNKDLSQETDRNLNDADSRRDLADEFGYVVEAIHSFSGHINSMPAYPEVLQLSHDTQQLTFLKLSQVLQRVQAHQCTETYCLRRKRGASHNQPPSCRLYFPLPLSDQLEFTQDFNPSHWIFAPKRNDPSLNNSKGLCFWHGVLMLMLLPAQI